MLKGIDFSYGNGLTTAQINDASCAFVCRYLSGGLPKDIDSLELSNYKAADIRVVFVWETDGLMPSRAQGIADARRGAGRARERLAVSHRGSVGRSARCSLLRTRPLRQTRSVTCRASSRARQVPHRHLYGYNSVNVAFSAGLVTFGWQTLRGPTASGTTRALAAPGPGQCPPRPRPGGQ